MGVFSGVVDLFRPTLNYGNSIPRRSMVATIAFRGKLLGMCTRQSMENALIALALDQRRRLQLSQEAY